MNSDNLDPNGGASDDSREKWITIDRLCDAYEASLQSGDAERAAYLAGVPSEWREHLTAELDAIDAAYRDAAETHEQTVETSTFDSSRPVLPKTTSRLTELTSLSSNKAWLGRFEIQKRLGTGATGSVWCARDARLARWVALKVPHVTRVMSETTAARFQTEARAAAAITHPNVVQVHEVLIEDGLPILIQQWIDGPSLAQFLKEHAPLDFDRSAKWMAQIADAVACAHDHGIVHRDLKPANVMLNKDRPMVLDFGLASYPESASELTSEGTVLGTPAYMSPEQADGAENANQPPTDIYALGTMLYEMVVGKPPFVGKAREVLLATKTAIPASPRSRRANVPRDLETIILRCLAKSPAARYQSAAELRDDLNRFLRREPIKARTVSLAETVYSWCRLHPAYALLATGLPLVLLLVSAMVVSHLRQQRLSSKANRLQRKNELGETERRELLAQRYMVQLARASQELSEGDRSRGLELLSSIPESVRGWEWRLLDLISHSPSKALNGPASVVVDGLQANNGDAIELQPASAEPVSFDNGSISSIAIARSRRMMFAASSSGRVLQWQIPEDRIMFLRDPAKQGSIGPPSVLVQSSSPINDLAVSPDGNWLGWVDRAGNITLWDLEENEQDQRVVIKNIRRAYSIAFSHDSKRFLVGGGSAVNQSLNRPADTQSWLVSFRLDSNTKQFDRESVQRWRDSPAITSMAWIDHDRVVITRGGWEAASSEIGSVEIWGVHEPSSKDSNSTEVSQATASEDKATASEEKQLPTTASEDQAKASEDAVSGEKEPAPVVIQPKTIWRGQGMRGVDFHKPSGRVAWCDDLGIGYVLAVADLGLPGLPTPKHFQASRRAATQVRFSPDGGTLVVTSRDGSVSSWKVALSNEAIIEQKQAAVINQDNDSADQEVPKAVITTSDLVIRHDRDFEGHRYAALDAQFLTATTLRRRARDLKMFDPKPYLITAGDSGDVRRWCHQQQDDIAKDTIAYRHIVAATWVSPKQIAASSPAGRRQPAAHWHRSLTHPQVDLHCRRERYAIGIRRPDQMEPDRSAVPRFLVHCRERLMVFETGRPTVVDVVKTPEGRRSVFSAAAMLDHRYLIGAVYETGNNNKSKSSHSESEHDAASIRTRLYLYDLSQSQINASAVALPNVPRVTCIRLSADQRHLLVATSSGKMLVVPLIVSPTGERAWADAPIMSWDAHHRSVRDFAWLADQERLVTVSDDGTCAIWRSPHLELADDEAPATAIDPFHLVEHRLLVSGEPVSLVSATSMGDRIVTAGQDRVIRLWDTQSGLELISLPPRKEPITAIEFSPDDQFLMIVEQNGGLELIRLKASGRK